MTSKCSSSEGGPALLGRRTCSCSEEEDVLVLGERTCSEGGPALLGRRTCSCSEEDPARRVDLPCSEGGRARARREDLLVLGGRTCSCSEEAGRARSRSPFGARRETRFHLMMASHQNSSVTKEISPLLPKNPLERTELEEDLLRMGCLSLLNFYWGFRVDSTVQELRQDPLPPPRGDSIRACPDRWTMGRWQEVYDFPRQGAGWTSLKKEEYARGKFGTKDAKNGYALEDCTDPRAKRVFSFLVPILHPEKPTRLTITLANTLYGAYLGERVVNWAIIVKEVVLRLTKSVNNTKRSPICSFLIHLYHHFKETTPEEDIAHGTQLMLKKFDGTESESEPGSEGGSSASQSEEEAQPPPKRQRQRQGGAPSTRTRAAVRASTAGLAQLEGKTYPASELVEALRVYVEDTDRTLGQVGGLVGNPPRKGLVEAIKERVGGAGDLRAMEQKVVKLTLDMTKMWSRALEAERSWREALLRANTSGAALKQVKEALAVPADAVAKAKMFDARLEREGHISSKRVIAFMVEHTVKLEEAYTNMNVLVESLTHILPEVGEDAKTSSGDSGSESETDSEEEGVPKELVILDSPDLPPRAPPVETPTPLSPSIFARQVQRGREESMGTTREPSPKAIPPPPPLVAISHVPSLVVPLQDLSRVEKTVSRGLAHVHVPVTTEDKSEHSSGPEVVTGAPKQVPVTPTRPFVHPSSTAMLLTPGAPNTSLATKVALPSASTPGVASSVTAELASSLATLATAATHPSSSKSDKKRKRKNKDKKKKAEAAARK